VSRLSPHRGQIEDTCKNQSQEKIVNSSNGLQSAELNSSKNVYALGREHRFCSLLKSLSIFNASG
jgi:hypothetical protein